MAFKAKQRQADGNGIVERLCSINSNGVVVMTTSKLDVSSEVAITVETSCLGEPREWQLLGWVVECQMVFPDPGEHYEVTLLFSTLPQDLQKILALHENGLSSPPYPPVEGDEIFGLN